MLIRKRNGKVIITTIDHNVSTEAYYDKCVKVLPELQRQLLTSPLDAVDDRCGVYQLFQVMTINRGILVSAIDHGDWDTARDFISMLILDWIEVFAYHTQRPISNLTEVIATVWSDIPVYIRSQLIRYGRPRLHLDHWLIAILQEEGEAANALMTLSDDRNVLEMIKRIVACYVVFYAEIA